MASFFTDLVKPYVEKLINGAITESSYICCFTCIAKDLEKEKARLEVERTNFKQHLDVAKRKGEDVQGNALSWDEEAEKFIQENTKTKQKCIFGFCCHCIWLYRRGKELANKKEQIKKFIETRRELAIGLPAHLLDVEHYSSQHYIPFKSRESKCKELLDALTDNNYIVVLQGMRGTGKTTLAKEVGKKLKRLNQFTHVIDTIVSFSPDIKRIQDDIARPLGLIFDDCNESDRTKKLRSRLTNGEKILIILDDVWGDINFDKIGIPQSDSRKGCCVFVTTHNLQVCKKLGSSRTILLDLLSEEEAWTMFKRHAGLSEVSQKYFLDRGRKIADECKRLPIAIAVIASSLKGKQLLVEWDFALYFLQKDMFMRGVDNDLVLIYRCLKFSYDNMENEKTKRLFLTCSLFQKVEEIPIEMLTRLCIGARLFVEDFGNYEDSRSQVITSKKELLDSCLLLEADCNMVKMDNIVHEVAQWIKNEEIQTIQLYNNINHRKAIIKRMMGNKYLLCEGKIKDVFSCKLKGFKLEILIVILDKDEDCHNVKIEVPNSFFGNITGLRVLHLFYNHYPQLSLSLPRSIQSLMNIRSLLFTLVDLGDISLLGNLQSLETLDLKDCKIHELPHGIAKLVEFRLLNLEGCEIERSNPFEVIERCPSLEELYFTGSFNAFCREITFPKLQRFCIDEFSRSVNDSSSKYVSVLDNDGVFLSETTLKYCMQTAEVLRLRTIEWGWRNLIPEIVSMDEGMNDIVELSLSCISQLQHLVDTKYVEFQAPIVLSKLVVLELDRMENLKELFNGPISLDSLKNLEKLSIKDCKHLRSLSECKLNLCNLKTIKVQNCPLLVSLFQPLTYRSLVLLEKLQISNCEGLDNIISDERIEGESREELDNDDEEGRASMLQKLKVLDVEGCPQLKYILPLLSAQGLPVLETIRIRSCVELKNIFDQDHSMIYHLYIWERVQCVSILQSHSMCNIKEINLSHFLKIKSVFILSITPRLLVETLTITNCDELKNIVIDTVDQESGGNSWGDVFPRLKKINVEDCKQLEYIFGQSIHDDHQNHNKVDLHLPTLEHINLCNMPGLVAMSTKQYRATFPPSAELEHSGCSQVAIKSFHGFVTKPISKSQGIEISVEEGSASTNAQILSSSSAQLIAPEHKSTSHKLLNEQSTSQLGEIDTAIKPSQLEGSTSEKTAASAETMYTGSKTKNEADTQLYAPRQKGIKISAEDGNTSANDKTITSSTHSESVSSSSSDSETSSLDDDWDGEISIPSQMAMIEPLATQSVVDDEQDWDETSYALKLEMLRQFDYDLQNERDLETTEDVAAEEVEVQATSGHMLQLCLPFQKDSDGQITTPSPPIATIEPLTPQNIDVENRNQNISLNDEAVMKISSTIEEQFSNNDETIISKSRLSSIASQFSSQDIKLTLEDITTLVPNNAKTITSSTHSEQNISSSGPFSYEHKTSSQEDGDGKISIPSFSTVNTNPPATKDVDIRDSRETIAIEDINKLIEEDPLLALVALEKLLTGQVSISSIRVLLQELKTLMDSSSDLDHLVSNQESILKLNSLFHRLNQHQEVLTSDLKDFVEKVQNFFNENVIKHATFQQALKKHNQLLDSKTDLMKKLWSVKSTQTHINSETSTSNAQIHEISLQIDELRKKLADLENQRDGLKSVVNKCDVHKMKLKAGCTELAQQSKKFFSAIASSDVDLREAERARNLANEGFANLKSSFTTF